MAESERYNSSEWGAGACTCCTSSTSAQVTWAGLGHVLVVQVLLVHNVHGLPGTGHIGA